MFLTSGSILHLFGSKQIEKVKGVLRTDRLVGALWLGGILALTAVPPFATFFSE
jgi:formate hydrogenlyase subunit 3/multisubunit Na+/H+ antiporter MnhD subunit